MLQAHKYFVDVLIFFPLATSKMSSYKSPSSRCTCLVSCDVSVDLHNMNFGLKYNLVKPALRRMKMSHCLTDAFSV
jgi:hypothetical protein